MFSRWGYSDCRVSIQITCFSLDTKGVIRFKDLGDKDVLASFFIFSVSGDFLVLSWTGLSSEQDSMASRTIKYKNLISIDKGQRTSPSQKDWLGSLNGPQVYIGMGYSVPVFHLDTAYFPLSVLYLYQNSP